MSGLHILFTFIGRVPRSEQGYLKTCYEFADRDDAEPPTVTFFGWALQQHRTFDKVVILGTTGSMWEQLLEEYPVSGESIEELRLDLIDAAEQNAITADQLARLQALLQNAQKCKVCLQLIPYCRRSDEQTEFLRILASHVGPGDIVDLDITHGFRHLPLLAFVAALYLRRVRDARIASIWYGAYDPDTGRAPVYDLQDALRVADWLEALAIYDYSGDYASFGALLPGDTGAMLADAAFYESVSRIGAARGKAKKALESLRQMDSEDAAASLFRPELIGRLAWAEQQRFYERQCTLAWQYLARHRFREAIIMGYEAFISRLTQSIGLKPDDPDHRSQARDRFDEQEKKYDPRRPIYRAWDNLRRLRNALVHGTSPKGKRVQQALDSPQQMYRFVEEAFRKLIPEKK